MKTLKVWIVKEDNKIENMSFFPSRKTAMKFLKLARRRKACVVSAIISFKEKK